MSISLINEIDFSESNFLENIGDFFQTPGRILFGRTYTLEHSPSSDPILKSHENFNRVGKIAAIALLPLTLLSTLFGYAIKSFAHKINPGLREKYSYTTMINARTDLNFSGIFPPTALSPNCVNSQEKSWWGQLYNADPISIPEEMEDPLSVMKTLFETVDSPNFRSSAITLLEENGNYLHYTYTVTIPSGPLKGTYIDDVDLYLNEEKQCFEIRSASRTGFRDAVHLDFSQPGANKKRIEAIREAFQQISSN